MDIKILENNKMDKAISSYNSNNISSGAAIKSHGFMEAGANYSKDTIGNNKYGQAAYKNGASFSDVQNAAGAMNVKSQTDYMTVMANTVSDKDMKRLMEHGYEPGQMKPEEIVTIVDEIKTTMAKAGVVVEGYNSDLDVDKVKEITGSDIYAYEIASSFASHDVPYTQENIKDAYDALTMAKSLTSLDASTISYMVENGVKPSIENLYMSAHSVSNQENTNSNGYFADGSGYIGKKAEEIDDKLLLKVEEIIENSGFEYNEETKEDALNMIKGGLMLTEESFAAYEDIKNLKLPTDDMELASKIARNIKDGQKAKETEPGKNMSLLDEAKELVQKMNDIKEEAVDSVLEKGMKLNLNNLSIESRRIVSISEEIKGQVSSANIEAGRALYQEARLHMSISSTYVLLKNNINVNLTDLSILVDELKEAENRQFESIYGQDKSKEIEEAFLDTKERIEDIKDLPIAVVGKLTVRTSYSLNVVYEEGLSLKKAYENAGEKYEPLMTQVRTDLGDSINKAFRNVDDILEEMDREVSEDNERAVKILGRNNMEITDENIEKVKETYSKLRSVLELMTPGKVLGLIKNGYNPLELNMDELTEVLNEDLTEDYASKEAEKYSHYLLRMEKKGQITEEEKESYIGIYRLINQIEKADGAAVGTLISQKGEINFKNLLSAVRTRKDKGMDFKIDDTFGFLEKLSSDDMSIDKQIERAYELNREESDNYERTLMEEAARSKPYINQLLSSLDIPGTVNNISALSELLTNSNNIFKNIKELSDKSTKKSQNVDKNVNNNAKNIEISDEIDDIIRDVNDRFNDKEDAKKAFDEAGERINDILSSLKDQADNHLDVRAIAAAYKQMNVVGTLADNEFYQVPVKVGEQYTSISVRIIHGSANDNGNVALRMDHEEYGEINASFKLSGDILTGYVTCSSEEGVSYLKEREAAFTDNISFEKININYAKSSSGLNKFVDNTDKLYRNASKGIEADKSMDAVSTKDLYKVAKEFIKSNFL